MALEVEEIGTKKPLNAGAALVSHFLPPPFPLSYSGLLLLASSVCVVLRR